MNSKNDQALRPLTGGGSSPHSAAGAGSTRSPHVGAPGISDRRAFYTLGVLSLVCMLNYYDRNLISILMQPISTDLHLSDSELGLVSGLAFALVYSTAALPIARLADRFGRKRVLTSALGIWSLMTGICGLVSSAAGLAAARFGVGLGEAGGLPSTHALVSDHFSVAWRARALSFIAVASGLGLALGSAGGGFISEHWGWRAAFVTAAVPGIPLLLLLAYTVREPKTEQGDPADRPGLAVAAGTLAGRRAFVWMCVGLAVAGIADYAQLAWLPTYLIRRFDSNPAQVGALYSLVSMIALFIGITMGGFIGDKLARRDPRWSLWLAAVSFGSALPLLNAVMAMPSLHMAIALVLPLQLIGNLYIAPIYALVQRLSGSRLRATGAAIIMMFSNLVGLGGGPTLTGWISDRIGGQGDSPALGVALALVSSFYLVGTLCFLFGTRSLIRDIVEADRE